MVSSTSLLLCCGRSKSTYLPRESRIDKGRDRSRRTLRLVRILARLVLDVRTFVGELLPHILLAPAELRSVDRDEQALDSALLGVLDNLARDVTVLVDIQLHELDLTRFRRVDDLVERARGQSRNHLVGGIVDETDACELGHLDTTHLNDPLFGSGPSWILLTVGMSELAERSRSDVNGWQSNRVIMSSNHTESTLIRPKTHAESSTGMQASDAR